MSRRNRLLLLFLTILTLMGVSLGCNQQETAAVDPEYDAQTITICDNLGQAQEVTVGDMRALAQVNVDETFSRTTGLMERFIGTGPELSSVLALKGINSSDYQGIGVTGLDGYYCLMTPELISERRLVLAITEKKGRQLPSELRPARLCALGEFGPYWVKMVDRIDLYKTVPEKNIGSVWVFKNLAAGIEPYEYEYYGSKDNAIELANIFSRFDQVSNKALFTMMSSDGFKKHESFNVVSSRYYIKIDGEDAPMNVSPDFKLGMNVKNLAWISTNADAAVFPEEIVKLTGEEQINGKSGVPLLDLLMEVEVDDVQEKQFELIDVDGEILRVNGSDLEKGILAVGDNGDYPVYWAEETGFSPIRNLLRIRTVSP